MSDQPIQGSAPDASRNSQPEAEPQAELGASAKQKAKKGLPKKRDTHFLCFPLVTSASVAQLATSLRYFRETTTKSARSDAGQAATQTKDSNLPGAHNASQSSIHDEPSPITDENAVKSKLASGSSRSSGSFVPELQILPAITHRPPGTFHLTLGVMDLSTEEQMGRALELLQELDYANILQEALMASQVHKHVDQETVNETSDPQQEKMSASLLGDVRATLSTMRRPISPPVKAGTSDKEALRFDKNHPPKISLAGISTFPSAKSSRVFYAKPSPSPSSPFPLLRFGQAIRQRFREAGFITETRPLVLHATVANMRYAVQARGGRTSKGKTWRYGKDRWKDGQVDAREVIKCFDQYQGNIEEYVRGHPLSEGESTEFIWAEDINLDRVAICKMGAEKSDDEVLGMVYPPVSEKMIFS